jgi:hypothetical protein
MLKSHEKGDTHKGGEVKLHEARRQRWLRGGRCQRDGVTSGGLTQRTTPCIVSSPSPYMGEVTLNVLLVFSVKSLWDKISEYYM